VIRNLNDKLKCIEHLDIGTTVCAISKIGNRQSTITNFPSLAAFSRVQMVDKIRALEVMQMKRPALLVIFLLFACGMIAIAQEQQPAKPTAEELDKQKEEWTKNAYRLLDQVIDESQSLRLPENRVRMQIYAADVLWDHDQGRARTMFMAAGDAVAEMNRAPEPQSRRGPGGPNQMPRPAQLRQELVLSAARHDAPLAYQLLASTKPQASTQATDTRQVRGMVPFGTEDMLEQSLLSAVAALDPKLAGQNADQLLEKGQFPMSLGDVITQLRRQDQEAATKLADKTVKRLQSANILSNIEASTLALGLLSPGPRIAGTADATKEADAKSVSSARGPVLDQSLYVDLLGSVIDSALKATPATQQNARGGNNPRGGGPAAMGRTVQVLRDSTVTINEPSEAQIEQSNARRLLAGVQRLLPQIDQNLAGRAQAVRQKLTEMGLSDTTRSPMGQLLNSRGDATADLLMQTAASAPAQIQPRLYQQAALKALDEGDTTRARQIASDHLTDARLRDSVMQRIDFRELATKADGIRLEEVRQSLARLQSDNERIDLLIQIANDVAAKNPKAQRQLLEEARQITNKRATGYDNFEQQLRVAHAFAAVDASRSFEILDPGISQLNELLSAAATLSGFEINVFRDGELPMQGGGGLPGMVNRYGQEIAVLAKTDFERSETLAGRFQFPESRIMARLAIVQGLLDVKPRQQGGPGFTFRIGDNSTMIFRP